MENNWARLESEKPAFKGTFQLWRSGSCYSTAHMEEASQQFIFLIPLQDYVIRYAVLF